MDRVQGDTHLPSDDLLSEHAFLVARGVRALALVGNCPADALTMTRVATRIEEWAESGAIPFVLDMGNGTASYGYAAARWPLDLYEWTLSTDIPQAQRERIVGLLLGYAVEAVSRYEDATSGRRFTSVTSLPGLASS